MTRKKTFCTVDDCRRPCYGHGMCSMHYLRWRRYGRTDLLPDQPRRQLIPATPESLTSMPRVHWVIWAAGFFDGEGCISIQHRRKDNCYYLKIAVPQVNPRPLKILHALFGGCLRLKKEKSQKDTHRQKHIWEASAKHASEIIRELEPYLINKGPEARVALEFQDGIGRARSYSLSDAERVRRKTLHLKIKELKWEEYE